MKNAAALLLIILPILSIAGNNPESASFFHKGDFEKVKAQASEEGKLIFVDFYADYCYACKLMDETTFVDPSLTKYVNNSYIPYKVNVTIDFDGIAMKDEYSIRVLPTILVFNSKGELVGRYESMLGPTRMIKELKKYDVPENRIKTGNTIEEEASIAETKPQVSSTITYNSKLTSKINTAPNRAINVGTGESNRTNGHATTYEKPKDESQTFGYAKPKTKVTKEKSTCPKKENTPTAYNTTAPVETKEETTKPTQSTSPEQDIVPVEGLFQFTVKPYRNQGYGVQIGVFAQYGNVLREVQKLQEKYNQPILVNISNFNNQVVYKIIVGAFDSTREAVAFRRMMRKTGSDGVIKDLSTIKL